MADTHSPVHVEIDPNGDLRIRLYTDEEVNIALARGGKLQSGKVNVMVKVSREVMIKNSAYFKTMLTRDWTRESAQTLVDLYCEHPLAAELWFRIFHKGDLPENFFTTPIEGIWEVIQYGSFLQATKPEDTDLTKLKPWFTEVIKRHIDTELDIDDMRMLLYPCFAFNHAAAFARFTKFLAYDMAGHTTEYNPTQYRHLHLNHNVIGALNGARGSLRTTLLRGLFDPFNSFLKSHCSCKERSLFAYAMGISKTGIWPIEKQHQKSINTILESPGFVDFKCVIPPNTCLSCMVKMRKTAVDKVLWDVEQKFNGLCLDCMTMSKTGNLDDDYWMHDRIKIWDSNCSITHGQTTWYFSFMGRSEDMVKHQAGKKRAWILQHDL